MKKQKKLHLISKLFPLSCVHRGITAIDDWIINQPSFWKWVIKDSTQQFTLSINMHYSVRNKSPSPGAKITSNPKNDCQFFLKFLNYLLNEHLISTVLDEDFMSFSWKDNKWSHQTSLSLVLFRMRFTIKTCFMFDSTLESALKFQTQNRHVESKFA